MPDYTVFNAVAAYRWNEHKLALNVNNAFDESHFAYLRFSILPDGRPPAVPNQLYLFIQITSGRHRLARASLRAHSFLT